MKLPSGTRFVIPVKGKRKYAALIPMSDGRVRRVEFGHRDYEHYRDSVPRELGGGRWSHRDHGDEKRRASYRKRHGGMRCADGRRCVDRRLSPAWFSYHFLW